MFKKLIILLLFITSCNTIIPIEPNLKQENLMFTPLNESGTYEGYELGLGATTAHNLQAPKIKSINGKVVMVSIGASVQNQISEIIDTRKTELTNTKFRFVNLAQPSKDINDWLTSNSIWNTVDSRLASAGILASEVQVVWLQDDILNDLAATFPESPITVKDSLYSLIQVLKVEFPKVKQIFVTGRPYSGFTEDIKHDEPKGYYNGWACRWLVEDQIRGITPAKPWLTDVPYIWTDGTTPRLDGFYIIASDYNADGVHLSSTGKTKFGNYMFDQFKLNPVSSKYFY